MTSRRGHIRRDGHATEIAQSPWSQARLTLEPSRILSDDHIEAIHLKSLQVLEEIGMDMLHEDARGVFANAGASVSGERVRIGRDIILEALKTPPSEFTVLARNPAHNIRLGGKWIAFSPVGGPPNCSDLDRGRRPGTLHDSDNFIRMAQFFNCISTAGGASADALDIHASIRHLHVTANKMRLSDKVPFASATGRARLFDSLEIIRLAHGVSQEEFESAPRAHTVINTNSPLKLDTPMAMGIMEMARHGQVSVITPFTLAGAMAPITLAGALVQQNAEALAGIALAQLVKPGAHVVYGGFTSNVDMKSGAPAFGTPEYMKACIIGGQLARRHKLPYRTSSTNAANSVDAQSAYETVFSLWGAIMGGGNLIQHAAGWLEGGLVASYEKFAMDIDLVQMVKAFLEPVDMSDDALGLEAMREVGPGGHFFGAAQTLQRFSTAFYAPLISDWRNFQNWQAAGSPDAAKKANAIWKQALAEYREPLLAPERLDAITAFVARRTEEGGEKTDF